MADHPAGVEPLVREAIGASRAGDHARARALLARAVRQDGDSVQAWLWLSGEVESFQEKVYCLGRVLALDPGNRLARQGLVGLQAQARAQEAGRPAAGRGGAGAAQPLAAQREGMIEAALEGRVGERPGWPRRERAAPRPGFVLRNEFALIGALGLVLVVLIAVANLPGVEGLPAPLPLLRLLLGLAFVLFVPGYALQAALFPRAGDPSAGPGQGLDGPERLALSFGLSVAIVPVLALVLDRLPWGIRLWPIVVSEGLVVAACSAVALWRRGRLPAKARPVLAVEVDVRGWWAAQDRAGRVLYGVLAGALALALVSAAAIVLLPTPSERFTEFYVLGPEGLAENYPREAAPGEVLSVTAGISNREGVAAEYRIEVRVEGETVGGEGPVTLEAGEVWEAPVRYALPRAGADQQVHFYLYRDDGAEPYRSLRLWIDVVEEGQP